MVEEQHRMLYWFEEEKKVTLYARYIHTLALISLLLITVAMLIM